MAQTQTSNEGPSNSDWRSGRKIRRLPEMLLRDERNHHDYIPKMVSIGPYHHGKAELRFGESFKSVLLEDMLKVAGEEADNRWLEKIAEQITEIRNCYEEGSTDMYDDDQLALMMLLDASFITFNILLYLIHASGNIAVNMAEYLSLGRDHVDRMHDHFGELSLSMALRDICLVDNQIPLWIVELLLSRITPGDEAQILTGYAYLVLFGKSYSAEIQIPEWADGDKDMLHVFELLYCILALVVHEPEEETRSSHVNCCFSAKERTNIDLESGECCRGVRKFSFARVCKCRLFKKAKGDLKILGHSFRSLTELKAKGIHLKPSLTQSLLDVKFKSNFMYAELQLPTLSACLDTKTLLLNMMCIELDANFRTLGVVISYINLMKSLIVKPDDVKELREKKILLGLLGSDEEIVKMYHNFDTHGANNPSIYDEVKDSIQAHYDSKTKTWMAELIHTYFRSPWTFITLLAATCLLVLTILQTVYTMKS
ncbi:hypothetical protein CDL12_10038 [Handroanthus impetiginosus]|uniref:DUF247 domain-containing protein n=1 Tax=Handroanthus impetiginosus TaxID=429701 RepID=A0A2G9HIF1_9LAMI|nr:hypothetical protein CDL12_10038 [Handroanthus impetiginosus]